MGTTAPAPAVRLDDVGVRAGRTPLVHDVTFQVAAGQVTALVGPNGSGKSTLLRTLFRAARHTGRVQVGGDDVARLPAAERVTRLAVLTQEQGFAAGTRTREVVELGRTARLGSFARLGAEDHTRVATAMRHVDVDGLAERDVATLSGGERQRAHIARVLAQDADVVVLDEPTNHLDIAHQITVLELLHGLAHDQGRAVVVALHDLSLAARWADHVVVLRSGRVVEEGPPEVALTPASIAVHFGVEAVWATVAGRRRLVVG